MAKSYLGSTSASAKDLANKAYADAGSATLSNKSLDNTNSITVKDSNFTIQDNADTTKQALFDASLIATGNQKTFSLPENTGTLLTRIKTGTALPSGGSQQYGIPGTPGFGNGGTWAWLPNFVQYFPFYPAYPVTLNSFIFEVTTGPSGAANVRVGLYQADSSLQPTGTILYDSGNIAVANGFTGVKTTSMSVSLTPGAYLIAVNMSVAMTWRAASMPSSWVTPTLGATPIVTDFYATQTYGAFPSTGLAWTATDTWDRGIAILFFRWTE